jgi:hypothetical protein
VSFHDQPVSMHRLCVRDCTRRAASIAARVADIDPRQACAETALRADSALHAVALAPVPVAE